MDCKQIFSFSTFWQLVSRKILPFNKPHCFLVIHVQLSESWSLCGFLRFSLTPTPIYASGGCASGGCASGLFYHRNTIFQFIFSLHSTAKSIAQFASSHWRMTSYNKKRQRNEWIPRTANNQLLQHKQLYAHAYVSMSLSFRISAKKFQMRIDKIPKKPKSNNSSN